MWEKKKNEKLNKNKYLKNKIYIFHTKNNNLLELN